MMSSRTLFYKISRLTQQCEGASHAEMKTDGAPDVSALQQMVTSLQAQLASQGDVVAAADVKSKAMEAANMRIQDMEARMAMMAPLPGANSDASISETAMTSKDLPAGNTDLLASASSGTDGKGKGKGGENAHY